VLAEAISRRFDCNLFHVDDFYLPFELRTAERMAIPGGHTDFERFLAEVLEPVSQGLDVRYRAFDCGTGEMEAERVVVAKPLSVIEGSYSHHPMLGDHYDCRIFVTCSPEEQIRRLAERESPAMLRRFKEEWIPAEERYFAQYLIEDRSDLRLDTSPGSRS